MRKPYNYGDANKTNFIIPAGADHECRARDGVRNEARNVSGFSFTHFIRSFGTATYDGYLRRRAPGEAAGR
jgi:hypothetical protein